MQVELSFRNADETPPTAVWGHRCPTCGTPPGMTCETAGALESSHGEPSNHQARIEKHRNAWSQYRSDQLQSNPLINHE